MGLMRSAWERLTLVWSTCGFHNGLPPDLQPQTMIEGPRYSLQIMERRPVDLLLVDASTKTPSCLRDPTPRWEQAIGSTSLAKRPLVILESWKGGVLVWENGPAGQSSKKRWDHLGYTTRVRHLDAQRVGGALVQPRLMVVHTLKTGEYRDWSWAPMEVGGAPRPMGNLIMPPGLLRTRYLPPSDFDEVTRLTIPHAQIDPMPNKPGAVIRTEKGIRHLQDEELARGLGLPKSWKVPPERLNQSTLSATTSSFHWEYLAQCLSQVPGDLQSPPTDSVQDTPVDLCRPPNCPRELAFFRGNPPI
jgi:hypothetical protein